MKDLELKKSIKWIIQEHNIDNKKLKEYYIEDNISKPLIKYEDKKTYIDYFIDVFGSLLLVYINLSESIFDSKLFKNSNKIVNNKVDNKYVIVEEFMASLYNYMYTFRQDIASVYRQIKKNKLEKKSVKNILDESGIILVELYNYDLDIISVFNKYGGNLEKIVKLYEKINSLVDKYNCDELYKLNEDFLRGKNDESLYKVYNGLIDNVSKEVYEITYNIDIEVAKLISEKESGYN